ncbi:Signal transduction histidine kinase [Bryocella elongata]|uniref:histidine kinase n=1 Tax=Bryocella elongata TaxID=863522 RepID=A0A1H6CBD9_9BACT|nr:ATP-binding protein [Bryocella elongata]SEG69985.1 Signal transduction histidine kinase [Bryocella elongata]
MVAVPVSLRSQRAKATSVVLLVFLLAGLTWLTPPRDEVLHNILHHLNILPFMLAGLFFGWRGAARTLLLAALLQTPSIYRHWHVDRLDADDQLVELSIFGAAGIIAGLLADRERMQRLQVEETKAELEHVYTELRQNIEQMKKTERLTAAGQLSASLAHEIRNPLASISGAAGILARGQASAESRGECLEILTKESQRLNNLLTNFLEFARPRLPRPQPTDPADLIYAVAALAQHVASARHVAVRIEADPRAPEMQCDPEQIKQLLLNLLLNAVQATPEHGSVVVRCITLPNAVTIEVLDEGMGVAVQDRERIFEPFFTTKETGTGLGLAIAANIAEQHGGRLQCIEGDGGGAVFRLELPRHTVAMRCRGTGQVLA